jgi:hypothetical protein
MKMIQIASRSRMVVATALVALTLASTPALTRADGTSTPTIVPISSRTLGMTYGQWGAAWWQYVYSIPVPTNPGFDTTGANCATGQANNPVFFLVGVFNNPATATRNCTVPANKMLFFPILNFENDNFCPPITPRLGVPQLLAVAKTMMDGATDLEADIDGVTVKNLSNYRAHAPGGFSITFPDKNVFQYFGCDIPAGTYAPFVTDGYWLMLEPLSVGQHTIHFHGSEGSFTLDITYNLTVA